MLKSKGFTLVEVILVVLIVGILAGIVIPRIQYSTNLAKGAACNATVSRVNSTIEYGYVTDSAITTYPTTIASLNASPWGTKFFPDPVPATCDLGVGYGNLVNGRIASHSHAIEE